MNATAAALAGPPQLGRSVLVSPGQAAPSPWSACERLVVRPDAFTMEVGRRLRDSWSRRVPLVVELEGDVPGGMPVWKARWWELSVGMTMRAEVLSHLLSSNVVDARDPRRTRFAPVDAAASLGAQICAGSGEGDVVTDSGPAWCDGGPLDAFDLTHGVIPAANLAAGSLAVVRPCAPEADLAGDQRAAVGHLGGAACIVAPAGSGKTRVLTERARYLVRDLGVTPSAVCLVAFNVRARAEMQERTTDLAGLEVRTLNSLALAICNGSGPFARPARHGRVEVIDEMGVRQRLDGLVKRRRRAMTDQLAPWLEALSASRLGLRDPAEVEQAFQPDVSDFVTLAPRLRRRSRRRWTRRLRSANRSGDRHLAEGSCGARNGAACLRRAARRRVPRPDTGALASDPVARRSASRRVRRRRRRSDHLRLLGGVAAVADRL